MSTPAPRPSPLTVSADRAPVGRTPQPMASRQDDLELAIQAQASQIMEQNVMLYKLNRDLGDARADYDRRIATLEKDVKRLGEALGMIFSTDRPDPDKDGMEGWEKKEEKKKADEESDDAMDLDKETWVLEELDQVD